MLINGCRHVMFILLTLLIFTVLPVSANQPFSEDWSTTPALPNSWANTFYGDVQQWVDTTSNKLHMVVRPYIPTSGQSRTRARFPDPGIVNSISTTITIQSINYTSDMVDTSAQISGIFYNKYAVKPNDALGDVFASLRVGDRGNGQLEAWLSVSESLDATFVTSSDLPSVQLANNLSLDTPYTVTLSFDGDRTFTGSISGAGLPPATPLLIVGPERIGAGSSGFYDFKELRARVYSQSGLTSNPDTNMLHAVFGPVAINGNPAGSYDPLTTPLQSSLWREPDGMATVTGSELKLQVKSADTEPLNKKIETQVKLPQDYAAYTYIQADLRIDKKPIRTASAAQVTLKKNWGNGLRKEIGTPEWAGTISSYAHVSKGQGQDAYDVGCALEMDDPNNEVSNEGYVGIFGEGAPALPDTAYTFTLMRVGTTISCSVKEKSSGKILVDVSENILNVPGINNFYDVAHSQMNLMRVRARGEHPSETIGYFDNIYVAMDKPDNDNLLFLMLPAILKPKESN